METTKTNTKEDILNQLGELMQQEDMEQVWSNFKKLKNEYHKAIEDTEHAQLTTFKEEGGEASDFSPEKDPTDEKFQEMIAIFQKRKEQHDLMKKEEAKQRLTEKEAVVEEMKALINDSARIGESFQKFREIQERWEQIEDVPGNAYRELQSEYHHQVELFYYHINIKKDLRDLDLKKNLEKKEELIERIKELATMDSVRKMRDQFIRLENEWHRTGPVPRDVKEEINQQFKDLSADIQQKTLAYFEEKDKREEEHLEAKKALVEQMQGLSGEEHNSHKEWRKATDKVQEVQDAWKKIGYSKENEDIWQEFRKWCDAFYEKKSGFYEALKGVQDQHKEKKVAICEEAEGLQDSNDWKGTADKLIKLQKRWKDIGPAHQRDENKLWKRFRKACDHFFDAKKKFFGSMDERQEANLEAKKALLDKIEAYQSNGDAKALLNQIKEFQKEWTAIGHVPKKEMSNINDRYQNAIDAHFKQLDLGKAEKAKMRYQLKVDSLLEGDDAEQALKHERRQIKEKIRNIEYDIAKYEDNLGFFAPSNKPNPLKKVVEDKIEEARKELEQWQKKLKMLPFKLKKQEPAGDGNADEAEGGNAD